MNVNKGRYTAPTAEEFKRLLQHWGLDYAEAARQGNIKLREIRRYIEGKKKIPYSLLFTFFVKNEGVQISSSDWNDSLI